MLPACMQDRHPCLYRTAGKYKSKIEVVKGDARLNAKSIMGIMSGGIAQGTTVTIEADGEDEQEALDALVEWCTAILVKSN